MVLFMHPDAGPKDALLQGVTKDTFRLGCTPVINLFPQGAAPIRVTHQRHEYQVLPDRNNLHGLEVYSVDAVTSRDRATGRATEHLPFYDFRHGRERRTTGPAGTPSADRRSVPTIAAPTCS